MMSNLESPGAKSSRGLGDIESGEVFEDETQFGARFERELSSGDSIFREDFASEDELPFQNRFVYSRATSNHKGVHFRQKNKKFVSRLCWKGRKLELGEYNTHDEAARAYHVGTFYYNKSSTCICGEDNSYLETLPCVPDNLSVSSKMAWVRERARHSAASIGTSETPRIFTSKRLLESGGSSFDARPGTPASCGTQGSCDNFDSTPTTPTTSGSADPDNSFWDSGADITWEMIGVMGGDWDSGADTPYDMIGGYGDLSPAIFERCKGKSAAPHNKSEITGSKRLKCDQTRSQGSPNAELQQGKNSNALTNQTLLVDHQADSQVKMTDCIISALVELREQGWEWTLKRRSRSSVEAGVLFSVPEGQHAAPALLITDIIINSFHELREQGWEVHLQPHGGGEAELRSELCVAPTGSAAQDKMKASKFSASTLEIKTWIRVSVQFGAQVVVKFSYAKQKLVWEVLESGQKCKMEIHWSSIDAMKAIFSNGFFETLQIEVSQPPSFFQFTSPQSMKDTSFIDFT